MARPWGPCRTGKLAALPKLAPIAFRVPRGIDRQSRPSVQGTSVGSVDVPTRRRACCTLAPGSALKKHHAVEYGADPRTLSVHRFGAGFGPWKTPRGPVRRGDLALRHRSRSLPPGRGKAPGSHLWKAHSARPLKGPFECNLPAELRQSGPSRRRAAGAPQEAGVRLFASWQVDGVQPSLCHR